jgi:hypothetical protein
LSQWLADHPNKNFGVVTLTSKPLDMDTEQLLG